jgi:rod shape-determining protein MreD
MASITVQPPNPVNWLVKPAAYCMAGSLMLALPVKVYGLQLPEPVFAMVPAFAWAVIRPSVLPPFALIALGLFQDVLWGGTPGLWPVCLLTVYGAAFSARRAMAAEGFGAQWAWYGAACALGFGAGVLLLSLVGAEVPNILGVALQFAVTAALFPMSWLVIERYEDADVRFH